MNNKSEESKMKEKQSKTPRTNEKKNIMQEIKVNQSLHQFIIIAAFHLLYIVFEGMNAFPFAGLSRNWISAIIYILICTLTIFFIWKEWDTAKYLVPIPFLSLTIVSWLLNFPEIITAIFVVYVILSFLMAFLKPDTIVSILTIIFSGFSFFLLAIFTKFEHGFYRVN
ncbi:MAG: hypothetical protein U9O98_04680, partial [Asgard group archaeon]|nr:hypothetical protein [Asgard group archaeon]